MFHKFNNLHGYFLGTSELTMTTLSNRFFLQWMYIFVWDSPILLYGYIDYICGFHFTLLLISKKNWKYVS